MKEETRKNLQKKLDTKFDNVTLHSNEHVALTENFENLLRSMAQSKMTSSEEKLIVQFKDKIQKFNQFLHKENAQLTEKEKRDVMIISGSTYSPAVKKRMADDVIHKIKQRIQLEKETKKNTLEVQKEIKELKETQRSFVGWFKLVLFALKYTTITPFTHRIKDRELTRIRTNLRLWLTDYKKKISPLLDKDYYKLSIVEYNSLVLLLDLFEPVTRFISIPVRNTYKPQSITEEFDAFTTNYIKILQNRDVIENAFKKAYKKIDPPEGLYGLVHSIIDLPLYNKKPILWNPQDKITKSITGVILSYYSTRMGCIVNSINQVSYILGINATIDNTKKHLTKKAEELKERQADEKTEEKELVLKKYYELKRILTKFIEKGQKIEELFYQAEPEYVYNLWIKEHNTKPIIRFKRLIESYIKYFIDFFTLKKTIQVEYDNNEHDFFIKKHELLKESTEYNSHNLGLSGSKVKDILNLDVGDMGPADSFFNVLMKDSDSQKDLDPKLYIARETLALVRNKTYRLVTELNRIITNFYNSKGSDQSDLYNSYHFFHNSTLKKSMGFKLHLVLNIEDITLKDFLEGACSIGYFIINLLQHPIIDALKREYNSVSEKADMYLQEDTPNETEELKDKITQLYKDTLTGFYNKDYLEDEVIATYYDAKLNYNVDVDRFVFIGRIDNFNKHIASFGPEIVNEMFKSIAPIFKTHFINEKTSEYNELIKYIEGLILGYVHNCSLAQAIETLDKINKEINKLQLKKDDKNIGIISMSFGIYNERVGTNIYHNIDVSRHLMRYAEKSGGNNIAFIKDQNKIIKNRDISNNRGIVETYISLLRK